MVYIFSRLNVYVRVCLANWTLAYFLVKNYKSSDIIEIRFDDGLTACLFSFEVLNQPFTNYHSSLNIFYKYYSCLVEITRPSLNVTYHGDRKWTLQYLWTPEVKIPRTIYIDQITLHSIFLVGLLIGNSIGFKKALYFVLWGMFVIHKLYNIGRKIWHGVYVIVYNWV